MAFDFKALVAGFATGAAESIESRNKQIRNGATKELDQLVQEATAKEKGLRTQRDTLTEQANQLASFANAQGVGFTKTQILGLIQQPATAKTVIEELKNKKDLRDVDFANIFKVTKPGTEMDPEEYTRRSTSIAKDQDVGKPTQAVRGAFGFASPGVAQAEKEFESVSGRTAAEVRSIARGRIDMGEDFKPTVGQLNLSQFAKPEGVAELQNRLADRMARGEDPKSPESVALQNQLSARTRVKEMFKEPGDEAKPRSTSAITTAIDRSLKANLYPYEKSGVIRWEKDNPEPIIMAGADEKMVSEYIKVKNNHIAEGFKDLGIIDKNNKLINPKDRNARDALQAHATVDEAGNVSWRKPSAPAGAGGNVGGGTAPVISEQPITVPADAIVNGKIDPTKMVLGQKYIENGKVRTWIGGTARWQQ